MKNIILLSNDHALKHLNFNIRSYYNLHNSHFNCVITYSGMSHMQRFVWLRIINSHDTNIRSRHDTYIRSRHVHNSMISIAPYNYPFQADEHWLVFLCNVELAHSVMLHTTGQGHTRGHVFPTAGHIWLSRLTFHLLF